MRLDLDGIEGAGECVPREYVTGETVDSVCAALSGLDIRELSASLSDRDFRSAVLAIEALDLPRQLARDGRSGLAAACALELALLDATGKRFGRPLRDLAAELELPSGLRREKPAQYPLPHFFDYTRTLAEFLTECAKPPHHVKIKVGQGREKDVSRIRGLREALGPGVRMAVDANMAWSLDDAVAMVGVLEPFGVAWYEEPLGKGRLEDCRTLRKRIPDAQIWMVRLGYTATHSFGGPRVREELP